MLDPNDQKEQFSEAIVHAIATVAGCNTSMMKVDNDSVDIIIHSSEGSRPSIAIQLKCTSQDCLKETELVYDLKRKNYDDLRAKSLHPRILVVVLVPDHVKQWVSQTEEQFVMRKCAYWYSVAGSPETNNTRSVRVRIPRVNIFSPQIIMELMQQTEDRLLS